MSSTDEGRRSFFQKVIVGGTSLIAGALVIPGIAFLLSPVLDAAKRRKRKIIFSRSGDSTSTQFVAARLEDQEATAPGLFFRVGRNGKPEALSAKCTHAGCPVQWKDAQGQFFCPCHQGLFDETGKVVSGPPPKPLESLSISQSNGELFVEVIES